MPNSDAYGERVIGRNLLLRFAGNSAGQRSHDFDHGAFGFGQSFQVSQYFVV